MGLLLATCSCHDAGNKNSAAGDTAATVPVDTAKPVAEARVEEKRDTFFLPGHYFSPDVLDSAYVFLSTPAVANEEDGENLYTLGFTSPGLAKMPEFHNQIYITNEGDLNGDGKDDITVFNEALHGCTMMSNTYYNNARNEWKEFGEGILIPSSCDWLSDSAMNARVFVEDSVVYRWEEDPKDDNFTQKKVKLIISRP